jgi:predicted esterase
MPIDIGEVEQRYHYVVAAGKYQDALQLATEHFAAFPPHAQRVVYGWQLDMAARLGDDRRVLAILHAAVTSGYWYANLDQDPKFSSLLDSVEFQRLVTLCAQRRAEEIANAQPVMRVLKPLHNAARYPTVMALHGNSSNVAQFSSHWSTAVQQGWLVAVPQSPQAHGPATYSWNDREWGMQSVCNHYAELTREYAIDREHFVLAGFSAGSGLALWLALTGVIETRGIIAVVPFLRSAEELRPLLLKPENKAKRIYLVASPQDQYCYQIAQDLAVLLTTCGIVHQLDLYADQGHAFPASFAQKLPYALNFVLER